MATKRALSARSIHVRIVPRPANLSESREILRVLRQFGEISIFKYMKYEYQKPLHNVALAIFRDERSAQEALNASPIRFTLEGLDATNAANASANAASEDDEHESLNTDKLNQEDNIDDIIRPSTLVSSLPESPTLTSTPSSKPLPFDPPSGPGPQKSWKKPFLLTLDHSHAVQADFIERQPFYKQFHPMRSMGQQDLEPTIPHPGLSDISKRPPGHFRTPVKVLKAMRQYVDQVMPRLKDMGKNTQAQRTEST